MGKALGEKVPNIREACVKCFHDMIIRWDKGGYKEMIKKQLAILAEDSDSEVKEKAKDILSRIWMHHLIEKWNILTDLFLHNLCWKFLKKNLEKLTMINS